MTIRFLDPTQAVEILPASFASRPLPEADLTIGLLSNNKQNADRLLRLVADKLATRLSIQRVVEVAKNSSSTNAPQEMLDELSEQCDLSLVAIGD